jgi:hypothetical protein
VAEATGGGFFVQGNKAKFRELEDTTSAFSGGLEKFSLEQQIGPNEKFTISGHALDPQQDYELKLGLDKTDFGFIHAGFDQWRKYYAPDGGFDPTVTPSQVEPAGDLYLNEGRAWVDFGLNLPHWPQMVLGYEYDYRNGAESTLDWGGVNKQKNIYPSTEGVNELTHILKFDLTNDLDGWHIEDSARLEFYSEKNADVETFILTGAKTIDTRDDYHHVQGMDTLMFEKPLYDWWLLSGGFYYSRLEGDDYFNQSISLPGFNAVLNSQQISLSMNSEVFSAASLFTPLDYLTFSLTSQNAWTHEDGFGASVPDLESGIFSVPANSSFDEFKASQEANFRFTRIPFTVVSGAAQVSEETVSEYQDEDNTQFMRDTAADNRHYNVQLGLSSSPWRAWEFSAQARRDDSHTDYNQLLDVYNTIPGPSNGYPAFILNRDIRSDIFETKIVWKPALWLKTTFTYQLNSTRYASRTDPALDSAKFVPVSPGGPVVDGNYNQETYGVGVTVTPMRRLYFSGGFTYGFSRADTADNADPSLVPYQGYIYTLNAAATYAFDAKTSLQTGYNFSSANYGENNAANGVPLGLNYTRHDLSVSLTRKFSSRLSGSLRYAFSQYNEPSSGTLDNFVAHGVFCSMTYKME